MRHALGRVLVFGAENIWRNAWLSVITTSTIVLAAFSVSVVIALQVGVQQVIRAVEERIDLSVYLYPGVSDPQVSSVITALSALPGVTQVTAITKEQALARYQERAAASPELLDPLKAIGQNPFGPSLIVRAASPTDYRGIVDELAKPQYRELIEGQQQDYQQNKTFIDSFAGFVHKVRTSGIIASAFFAFIAMLLTLNAIRVAVYTHRDEIAVMKLVGASNWFIRAPFLVETIFYSVAAIGLAAGLMFGLLYLVQPYLDQYFGAVAVNLLTYFQTHGLVIFGAELAAMVVITVVSGSLALRRYLRV